MSLMIKICGFTEPVGLAAAVAAGVDAVGFVFAPSPRQISIARAVALCHNLPDHIVRVAVMRHPPCAAWEQVRDVFQPDWLQTDAQDFAGLNLPPECLPLPVYRDGMLRAASLPERWPAQLLFEGARSGAGETADWSLAATLANRARLVLAGGLNSDNVATAIARVKPWGVDVSSGVESAPGQKDPTRIEQFVARARAAASTA